MRRFLCSVGIAVGLLTGLAVLTAGCEESKKETNVFMHQKEGETSKAEGETQKKETKEEGQKTKREKRKEKKAEKTQKTTETIQKAVPQ